VRAKYPAWFQPDRPNAVLDLRHRVRIEQTVRGLFAGGIAEAKALGRHNWAGANSDRLIAIDLLTFLVASDRELTAYLKLLWIQTQQMVGSPRVWPLVEATAAELVARRHLTKIDILRIVKGHRFVHVSNRSAAALLGEALQRQVEKTAKEVVAHSP
jgi:hypothetical protein